MWCACVYVFLFAWEHVCGDSMCVRPEFGTSVFLNPPPPFSVASFNHDKKAPIVKFIVLTMFIHVAQWYELYVHCCCLALRTILFDSLKLLPWWTAVLFGSLRFGKVVSSGMKLLLADRLCSNFCVCVSDTFRKIIAQPALYSSAKPRVEITSAGIVNSHHHTLVWCTHICLAGPELGTCFKRQRPRINRWW